MPNLIEAARRGRGEGVAFAAKGKIMNRRGIEFTLVQIEPEIWRWQFRIGETLTTGKTNTKLKGMAAQRVQQRID